MKRREPSSATMRALQIIAVAIALTVLLAVVTVVLVGLVWAVVSIWNTIPW